MAFHCTTARGARIAEPGIGNAPDEDAGPPVCGFCGDVEVSDEGQTCAECLAVQAEREAENDDPEGFYAEQQMDQDRIDGRH
jgi:hypothetical protein